MFNPIGTEWMQEASCRDLPQFTDDHPSFDVTAICKRCPVINECRAYAYANNEEYLVWGGLTANQRKRRLNQMDIKLAKKLGLTQEQLRDVLSPNVSEAPDQE